MVADRMEIIMQLRLIHEYDENDMTKPERVTFLDADDDTNKNDFKSYTSSTLDESIIDVDDFSWPSAFPIGHTLVKE